MRPRNSRLPSARHRARSPVRYRRFFEQEVTELAEELSLLALSAASACSGLIPRPRKAGFEQEAAELAEDLSLLPLSAASARSCLNVFPVCSCLPPFTLANGFGTNFCSVSSLRFKYPRATPAPPM